MPSSYQITIRVFSRIHVRFLIFVIKVINLWTESTNLLPQINAVTVQFYYYQFTRNCISSSEGRLGSRRGRTIIRTTHGSICRKIKFPLVTHQILASLSSFVAVLALYCWLIRWKEEVLCFPLIVPTTRAVVTLTPCDAQKLCILSPKTN